MPNAYSSTKDYNVVIADNSSILSYNSLHNLTMGSSTINGSSINNSVIGNDCIISYSSIEESKIGDKVSIGVYSHLRKGSTINNNVRIGNFVETKQCQLGLNTKVAHLTYIGDATVGDNVNVGCGTVFCNYNGVIKQHTNVGDNVFIGSNSNLVAPVNIESNSFIAAGSTITNDVPSKCLAIARARQVNKDNYYT